jgi:hypothetical protein
MCYDPSHKERHDERVKNTIAKKRAAEGQNQQGKEHPRNRMVILRAARKEAFLMK